MKAGGQSTADLENQRDAAVATLSQLVDVKLLEQPNGDVLITTASRPDAADARHAQFAEYQRRERAPNDYYPSGGIPAIMLGGVDVTSQLQGGQIGANIALRDTTLPTDQAELDELAQNLASRFSDNGLTLFTDPDGTLPVNDAPTDAEWLCRICQLPSRSTPQCRTTLRWCATVTPPPAFARPPASPTSSTLC